MKIGIATRHNALNAGAILQAYALQTCLEEMGHQVEFIDADVPHNFNLRKYVSKSPIVLFYKWIDNFNSWWYGKNPEWNKCLYKSPQHYRSYKKLESNPPIYDRYIVGSDQVWNFVSELSPLYLLQFVPQNKRRIAYSASMGQCNVPKHLYEPLRLALSQFYAISLREDSGVSFVNKLMNDVKACKTVDPTLLIDRKHYDKICANIQNFGDFAVSYILSQLDRQQCLNLVRWCKQIEMPTINLRNPATCIRLPKIKNRIVTPYQWLGYIKKSKIIISGSFHATVFALIYHKPFIVILPQTLKVQGGNARINSLLEPLGLTDHIVYDFTPQTLMDILNKDINWEYIDTYIRELRKNSIQFLKSSII